MLRYGVHLSKMSGKLRGLLAINTCPLSNPYCTAMSKDPKAVCSKCYSRYMLTTFRKSAVAPFEYNASWLKKEHYPSEYPELGLSLVRFLAHGELEDFRQAVNLFRIAKYNPDSRFGIWTKRMDIIEQAIPYIGEKPKNIMIIQSSRFIGVKDEKHDAADMVFTVYEKAEDMEDGSFVCSGKSCVSCKHCYTLGNKQDVSELITVRQKKSSMKE